MLCIADPAGFRSRLRAHVATMTPLGFNAHALGLLAVQDVSLLTGTTVSLASQYVMLRAIFQPWSDELVTDLHGGSGITQACLPAVPHDLLAALPLAAPETAPVTRLHAAMLSGSSSRALQFTHRGLQQYMSTLVRAGVFDDDSDARRACMHHREHLISRSLKWLVERKAAVLEAGGTIEDARLACRCPGAWKQLYRACYCSSRPSAPLLAASSPATFTVGVLAKSSEVFVFTCSDLQRGGHMCRQAFSITSAFTSNDRVRLLAGYGASGVRASGRRSTPTWQWGEGQAELQAFKDRVHARLQRELPTQGERAHASLCCLCALFMPRRLIFDFALGHTILMFACAGKCATIPFFDTNVEHDTNCCLLKTCGLNVTFGPAPTSSVSQCACLSVWRCAVPM